MNDIDHSTSWRRYADKFLLFKRKSALVTLALWVLCALLHKGIYGPFYTSFVPDGLAGNNVLAIYQDQDGDLWFGTQNGLSRYTRGAWRILRVQVALFPYALFVLGTVVIPLYLLLSLAYTAVSNMTPAQYLALGRQTLWLAPVFIVAVFLHGALYALFYEHYSRVGGDEAVFFIVALLGVPLYFVVSLVYTVFKKVKN